MCDRCDRQYCLTFGALFGDKNRFTFIGLSVLTCAIYHTSPCQSLVRTKMDPTGNKSFWIYGLSMGIKIGSFESVKMGVGVSFTSNSLAHSKNSYVLVKFNVIILVFLNLTHFDIYKYHFNYFVNNFKI